MSSFHVGFTVGSSLSSVYPPEDVYDCGSSDQLTASSSEFWSSSNYEDSTERFLKSAWCMKEGEVIFSRRDSIVYLPNLPTSTMLPVCVNCGKVLKAEISGWRDANTCIICHWPACENGCDFEEGFVQNAHSTLECLTMFSAGREGFVWNGDPTRYVHLWVVRFALLKAKEPLLFKQVMGRVNFRGDQFSLASPTVGSDEVVDVIQKWFPTLTELLNPDEIVTIGQVMQWKLKPFPFQAELGIQVQPLIVETFFAHSCKPNIQRVSQTDPFKWIVEREVKDGDLLTFSYDASSVFSPTSERRRRLLNCYDFHCTCLRCNDFSEFGTHFSLFPCWSPECSEKELPCDAKLDFHPSIWQPVGYLQVYKRNRKEFRCSECKASYSSHQLTEFQLDFRNRVYRSRDSLFYLNSILKRENKLKRLHSTNFMFFQASWNALILLAKSKDVTDISFLEEAHYMDYVLTAESVHFVVKSLCPGLFVRFADTNNHPPIFRVIALIRLAILTDDLESSSVTLLEVERRLTDIYFACNQEPRILSTVSKQQLFHERGEQSLQAGTFAYVEHSGVKMFEAAMDEYVSRKTVIFKLRKKASKG